MDTLSPRKVLMTTDAVGGVWQYSLDLIRCLSSRNHEVTLAILGPRASAEQRSQLAASGVAQVLEGDFALEWMDQPWTDVDRSAEWLLSLEREWQPDLIHLNGYVLASVGWKAPVVSVAHSCVWSWWAAVHQGTPGVEWFEYKHRVAEGLAASATVIAPSAAMAGALEVHYGLDRQKLQVVYNFSLASVAPADEKRPYILSAGRMWDRAKNLSLLCSVAPDLEWPLYVAGSESPGFSENSIPSKPLFLGKLPHGELLSRMQTAAIFAHPALYEPFGLAILEAAKAGCCLVLADIPSLREIWEGAALFVDPCDPESWTHVLNTLTADASKRKEIAARSLRRAARYNAEDACQQYLDVYDAVLRQAHNKAGVAA